jgi:hypothetical protein
MDIVELEKELENIKERNLRVEADKAWETSFSRKLLVAVSTYFVVVLFFFTASLPRPFISALVPTAGFLLSTLSFPLVKKLWVQYTRTPHEDSLD